MPDYGLKLSAEDFFDLAGQGLAVCFRDRDRSHRLRVGVTAAALHEERDGAGMFLLQRRLCDAGEIAMDGVNDTGGDVVS
jgi:hypothetical protein